MNEPINDGGPAFPDDRNQTGMSLRDYFAAKVLTQFWIDKHDATALWCGTVPDGSADCMAQWCYRVADAMLKAREAK